MLRFNRFASLFLASALGAAASTASAQQPHGQPAVDVASVSALPAGIRDRLAAEYGEVSDRGGPFNPGCVVIRGTPRHRLVSVSLANNHAVVAVEHGGIAHYVETLEFDNTAGRWEIVRGHGGALHAGSAQAR